MKESYGKIVEVGMQYEFKNDCWKKTDITIYADKRKRGELLALLWTDLDTENRTISITKQVTRIKGELVVSPPKTQDSTRTLVIPQQVVDLLAEQHKKHPGNPSPSCV